MKVGSIVEFTGKQDIEGIRMMNERKLPHLQRDYPYIIMSMGELPLVDGVKMCVNLEEYGWTLSFAASMFTEIQSPQEVNLDEINKTNTDVRTTSTTNI